jgi:hypothetical protein
MQQLLWMRIQRPEVALVDSAAGQRYGDSALGGAMKIMAAQPLISFFGTIFRNDVGDKGL